MKNVFLGVLAGLLLAAAWAIYVFRKASLKAEHAMAEYDFNVASAERRKATESATAAAAEKRASLHNAVVAAREKILNVEARIGELKTPDELASAWNDRIRRKKP